VDVTAICDTIRTALDEFGDTHGTSADRRFRDYRQMHNAAESGAMPVIEMAAVSTPDTTHRDPVVTCLERGIDVFLPKPIAGGIADADGDANPSHGPRFLSSADFAARITPVGSLTAHIADSCITITGLRPLRVTATGYTQRLVSPQPIPVDGYDLVDLELDRPGLTEVTDPQPERPHVLFRTFGDHKTVTGFGMAAREGSWRASRGDISWIRLFGTGRGRHRRSG
jgi:predicted dehydrogenase